MNRYQLEVAESDRRYRLQMRAVSCIGAACVVIVTLWSAGLPPAELWDRLEQWFGWADKAEAPPAELAPHAKSPPVVEPNEPANAASVADGTTSSLSVSPQPLYLLATAPGRNVHEGTASIGTVPSNPQTYVAGAMLLNGAVLAEIHRDHVVLTRGERSARLPLYKLSKPAAKIDAANDLLAVGGPQKQVSLPAVSREVVTDYLRPSPVYDGETLTGYQVYPGQKVGVFAQLGLQPGDVITSINDAPLSEPTQAVEQLRQIASGVAVVATVLRRGAIERITLDGAVIVADQDRTRSAGQMASMTEMP